ncbi:MAG: DUF3656 domain-containing protein [Eubacteriales bacterium]
MIKPELLSPAGGMDALRAAVAAGADAVYFGSRSFNARMRATGFSDNDVSDALSLLHLQGLKGYITLNTLVGDTELAGLYDFCSLLYSCGADAVIVQDLGVAKLIHERFPDLPLHASTQTTCHSASGASLLRGLGFTRVVAPRELSREGLTALCRDGGVEVEAFVHGALCVSVSGQCLLSSLIGGRSANRGECAQPCRLPYTLEGKDGYPLSLKDLSLAPLLPQLVECGVSSLKIEGRMKSADYVHTVTKVYRTLLDEGRGATPDELSLLSRVFSRQGFTDGYFTSRIGADMYGVRSEQDKEATADTAGGEVVLPKIPVEICYEIRTDSQSRIEMKCGDTAASADGAVPEAAKTSPLTPEGVEKQLSRLGNTPFVLADIKGELGDGLSLSNGALNALRRDVSQTLEDSIRRSNTPVYSGRLDYSPPTKAQSEIPPLIIKLSQPDQLDGLDELPDAAVFVPLHRYEAFRTSRRLDIIPPRFLYDSELDAVLRMAQKAKENGAQNALCSNIGHIVPFKELGYNIYGDIGMNLYNSFAMERAAELGLKSAVLSAELPLSSIKRISKPVPCYIYAYGILPAMLLESCPIKAASGCKSGKCEDGVTLKDRTGASFPLVREYGHRMSLHNSLPVYLADKTADIQSAGVGMLLHFTTESAQRVREVLRRYKQGLEPDVPFTRGRNFSRN